MRLCREVIRLLDQLPIEAALAAAGLISTAQEKDDSLAGLLEVDAVSRPEGYSHLADAGTDRSHIPGCHG